MSLPDIDLSALTDEEIHSRYRLLADELSRRHELESAPGRVREICARHCELGGDPQVLADEIHTVAAEHEEAQAAAVHQNAEKS